ncbi:DNA-binding MltR family transcriptional regulator [Bradyrhizobium elkanii]|uniref:transcriptional regulator n=1 Tax=Bradyrhizobium elkanii TaxID=29448 RepID=UPI002169DB10|nr:transcriptional regulator [Bradyrhizobium elkanii]MCS3479369.1 DNA-binding MltR family transcriptional regulator [Bradyrhizobium elkanii]
MTEKSFLQQYAEFRDEVWEKDPHYRGFYAALQELNAETDRGVALVATSFLDKLLKDTLAAFLIDNASAKELQAGFNAPLGTFSATIAACHALGLINDHEAGQITILRKVRNEFAHQVQVTFDNGRVKDLCNNLLVPDRDKDAKPRQKFMTASMLILIAMLNRPLQVEQKRLTFGDWKSAT